MWLELLATGFFVAMNGFFVGAEFALVKVREAQLETETGIAPRNLRAIRHIRSNLNAYLSATQLGITFASMGLGYVGERVFARLFIRLFEHLDWAWAEFSGHAVAFTLAYIVITFLHIVFGELAPKTVSIRYPVRTTRRIALPMVGFYRLFKPFIELLNQTANAVVKLFGVVPLEQEAAHSEEELRYMLAESRRGGAIRPEEFDFIERVFKFDDRVVTQIMIPRTRIFAVDLEAPQEDILQALLQTRFSRIPVYRGSLDRVQGIIYVKDLLFALRGEDDPDLSTLIRPARFIPESKPVNALLRLFQREQIHIAIITDEFGGTVGLVTLEDVIEELIGEIYDEFDRAAPGVEHPRINTWVLNAQTSILDLNSELPAPLPESTEYGTLAGYILSLTGKLPREGDELHDEHYTYRIRLRSKNRIERVEMVLHTDADDRPAPDAPASPAG